jgi:lipoyl(octanoyl) transferase
LAIRDFVIYLVIRARPIEPAHWNKAIKQSPVAKQSCNRKYSNGAMKPVEIRRLGVVAYGEALAMQRALVEERRAGRVPDLLLLLQHPPVITLGVKADAARSNIVAAPDRLAALGVEVHEAGRGGDVTYHGPGQVVGYPILDLRPDRCDVHRYVRDVEEVMIRVCADYGVEAGRIAGLTGAWVNGEKIGAIGVRISRWVTSHGFAFNVATNLEHFSLIVPCGIGDRGVTSLTRLTGRDIAVADVEEAFIRRFAEVFDRELPEEASAPLRTRRAPRPR